jgi:hypothetical protein
MFQAHLKIMGSFRELSDDASEAGFRVADMSNRDLDISKKFLSSTIASPFGRKQAYNFSYSRREYSLLVGKVYKILPGNNQFCP